jgi:cbb3-type cytochrome oxidase subunit 3
MDLNDLRIAVTIFGLALFVTLMIWNWRPARRQALDEAAQLPFTGDTDFALRGAARGQHHE